MVPSALKIDGWLVFLCEMCVVQLFNGIGETRSAYSLTCLYLFIVCYKRVGESETAIHWDEHTSTNLYHASIIRAEKAYNSYVTIDDVSSLLFKSPETNCGLDPIPISLLKQGSHVLLPTITNIIILSFSAGVFPEQFKSCSVHPHLENSDLDKEDLSIGSAITALYLIFLCYLNLLEDWSSFVSRTIYLAITYSIHFNQFITSIILLKLLHSLFMIASSMP